MLIWDDQTPKSVYERVKGCYDLVEGFKICWDLDINGQTAVITIQYHDDVLGTAVLDPANSTVHFGFDKFGFTVSLDVSVDWNARQLRLDGSIKIDRIRKWNFNVVIFQW